MKTSNLSRILVAVAVLLVVFSTFSCNRGYGCPSNFSLDVLTDAVTAFVTRLF